MKIETNTLPKSLNESWGFYGTIATAEQDVAQAWQIAVPKIMAATGCGAEAVRGLLDSAIGRHFADMVVGNNQSSKNLEEAIDRAITAHQKWTIGREASRRYGIPAGLPYLTGWVAFYEIEIDLAG
jgi:hypothetical protein